MIFIPAFFLDFLQVSLPQWPLMTLKSKNDYTATTALICG